MTKIIKEKDEVIIVGKSGARTIMPNLWMAESYARGLWKGQVKKIEVTTTYVVEDEKLYKELLEDVTFGIQQLESDRANVGDENVIRFIEDELFKLNRKKKELEHSLEVINQN